MLKVLSTNADNYTTPAADATGPEVIRVKAVPRIVIGRSLAHGKRDPAERALLGADLFRGRCVLGRLTVRQLAALTGASVPYVTAAIRVAADPGRRRQVERGELALLDAAATLRPARKPAAKPAAPSLIELFAAATPATRAACIRAFPDEAFDVLDTATAPTPVPDGSGAARLHA